MSKDVRIRSYFSKRKGLGEQKRSGTLTCSLVVDSILRWSILNIPWKPQPTRLILTKSPSSSHTAHFVFMNENQPQLTFITVEGGYLNLYY